MRFGVESALSPLQTGSSSLESHQSTRLVKLLVLMNSQVFFFFLVLCFIMSFNSVKACGQINTHLWKCICWHLDVGCQGGR